MKDLRIIGLTLAVLLATAGIVKIVYVPPPLEATPRMIVAEPGFYTGKKVRLSTGGLQPGDTPDTIVYRTRADLPPVLIFVFSAKAPDPLPPFLVGECVSTQNGVTTILVTRP